MNPQGNEAPAPVILVNQEGPKPASTEGAIPAPAVPGQEGFVNSSPSIHASSAFNEAFNNQQSGQSGMLPGGEPSVPMPSVDNGIGNPTNPMVVSESPFAAFPPMPDALPVPSSVDMAAPLVSTAPEPLAAMPAAPDMNAPASQPLSSDVLPSMPPTPDGTGMVPTQVGEPLPMEAVAAAKQRDSGLSDTPIDVGAIHVQSPITENVPTQPLDAAGSAPPIAEPSTIGSIASSFDTATASAYKPNEPVSQENNPSVVGASVQGPDAVITTDFKPAEAVPQESNPFAVGGTGTDSVLNTAPIPLGDQAPIASTEIPAPVDTFVSQQPSSPPGEMSIGTSIDTPAMPVDTTVVPPSIDVQVPTGNGGVDQVINTGSETSSEPNSNPADTVTEINGQDREIKVGPALYEWFNGTPMKASEVLPELLKVLNPDTVSPAAVQQPESALPTPVVEPSTNVTT